MNGKLARPPRCQPSSDAAINSRPNPHTPSEPKNARRLLESIADLEEGRGKERKLAK